jgi:putative flippase GtrA
MERLNMSDMSRFMRFGLVGALGFVVDAGVMQLLVSFAGMGAIESRAVSIPTAVFATWLLNRSFTFGKTSEDPALASLLRYAAVSAGGATINFLVYTALVLASSTLAAWPMIPLAIASIVALVFNYLGSKHFAFR